ncbi:MAG: hypothetical protein MUE72_11180 [Chitinophagaceae bacterium]|nr:hypothetical protein [Chitinophagaceae bacterium]
MIVEKDVVLNDDKEELSEEQLEDISVLAEIISDFLIKDLEDSNPDK